MARPAWLRIDLLTLVLGILIAGAIMQAFGLTAVLVYGAGLSLLQLIFVYAENARRRRTAGLRPRHIPWLMISIAGVPLLAVALYVAAFLHAFGLPPDSKTCANSLVQPTPCACYWAKIRGYKCI